MKFLNKIKDVLKQIKLETRHIFWRSILREEITDIDRIGNQLVHSELYSDFRIPNLVFFPDIRIIDLFWLTILLKENCPKKIMEFGTFSGLSTLYLSWYSPADAHIITIDMPDDTFMKWFMMPSFEVGMRFKQTDQMKKIQQIAADLRTIDIAAFEKQDFIFIDAGHRYCDVKHDTENALQLIRPGGVIVWHDYGLWLELDVVRYLNKLNRSLPGLKRIKGTSLVYLKTSAK